jgi:hypothetical protein
VTASGIHRTTAARKEDIRGRNRGIKEGCRRSEKVKRAAIFLQGFMDVNA